MLANLSLVNCYDPDSYDNVTRQEILLASAKHNLKELAFFGLKEFPRETQYLFEHTFNLEFKRPLDQTKPKTIHGTKEYFDMLKPTFKQQIRDRNKLDIRLYAYAKELFMARYHFTNAWRSRLKSSTIS